MQKDIFQKLPLVLYNPKQYFNEVFAERHFATKDVMILVLPIFLVLVLLHSMQADLFQVYSSVSEIVVFLLAFALGLGLSFIFRIYFLSFSLRKAGYTINTKSIGMIVGISMLAHMVVLLLTILFQLDDWNLLIEFIKQLWKLVLILIGLEEVTKIPWTRALLIVLVMFAFEAMVRFAFIGMSSLDQLSF